MAVDLPDIVQRFRFDRSDLERGIGAAQRFGTAMRQHMREAQQSADGARAAIRDLNRELANGSYDEAAAQARVHAAANDEAADAARERARAERELRDSLTGGGRSPDTDAAATREAADAARDRADAERELRDELDRPVAPQAGLTADELLEAAAATEARARAERSLRDELARPGSDSGRGEAARDLVARLAGASDAQARAAAAARQLEAAQDEVNAATQDAVDVLADAESSADSRTAAELRLSNAIAARAAASRLAGDADRDVNVEQRTATNNARDLVAQITGATAAQARAAAAARDLADAERDVQRETAAATRVLADSNSSIEDRTRAEERLRDAIRERTRAAGRVNDVAREQTLPGPPDDEARNRVVRLTDALDRLGSAAPMGALLFASGLQWSAMAAGAQAAAGSIVAVSGVAVQFVQAVTPAIGAGLGLAAAMVGIASAGGVVKLAVDDALTDAVGVLSDTTSTAEETAEAMSKLGPEAQAFARELAALHRGPITELRAATQDALLPGLTTALERVSGLFPIIERGATGVAGELSRVAQEGAAMVTSPLFRADLGVVVDSNSRTVGRLGNVLLDVVDTLRNVTVVGAPFLDYLGHAAESVSTLARESAQQGRDSGGLAAFYERSAIAVDLLGRTAGQVGGILGGLFRGSRAAGGQQFLDLMLDATTRVHDFVDSAAGQREVRDFFVGIRPAARELGGLVLDIGKAFVALGQQQGLADLIGQVRQELLPAIVALVQSFSSEMGPALVTTTTQIVRLFSVISDSPIIGLVKQVGDLAGGLASAVQAVPGLGLLLGYMVRLAIQAKLVATAMKLVGVGQALDRLRPAIAGLTAGFTGMTGPATGRVDAFFRNLGAKIAAAKLALGTLTFAALGVGAVVAIGAAVFGLGRLIAKAKEAKAAAADAGEQYAEAFVSRNQASSGDDLSRRLQGVRAELAKNKAALKEYREAQRVVDLQVGVGVDDPEARARAQAAANELVGGSVDATTSAIKRLAQEEKGVASERDVALFEARRGYELLTGKTLELGDQSGSTREQVDALATVVGNAATEAYKAVEATGDLVAIFNDAEQTEAGDTIFSSFVQGAKDALRDAEQFASNLTRAFEQGYDPALIADLAAKGPAEAGPLLEGLVQNASDANIRLFSDYAETLGKIAQRVAEQARIMAIASDAMTGSAEKTSLVPLALRVQSSVDAGITSIDGLARKLGVLPAEIERVKELFGLDYVIEVDTATATGRIDALAKGAEAALRDGLGKAKVELDYPAALAQVNQLRQTMGEEPLVVPVGADDAVYRKVLEQARKDAEVPAGITLTADAEQAYKTIRDVVATAGQPIRPEVLVNARHALDEVNKIRVSQGLAPIVVPAEADAEDLLAALDAARRGAEHGVTMPVRIDATAANAEVRRIADEVSRPGVVPVKADLRAALDAINAIREAEGLEPIIVPADASTRQLLESVRQAKAEAERLPMGVTIDATQANRQIMELVAAVAAPNVKPVEADIRAALDVINALRVSQGREPIVVPGDADTAQLLEAMRLARLDAARPVTVPVNADTSAADAAIQAFRQRADLDTFSTHTIQVIETEIRRDAARAANNAASNRSTRNARGGVQNVGGYTRHPSEVLFRSFAIGGDTLPRQAMIAPPRTLVQWAEPETGGEAFIPLAPANRPRSTSILAEVAERFGLTVTDAVGRPVAGSFTTPPSSDGGPVAFATGGFRRDESGQLVPAQRFVGQVIDGLDLLTPALERVARSAQRTGRDVAEAVRERERADAEAARDRRQASQDAERERTSARQKREREALQERQEAARKAASPAARKGLVEPQQAERDRLTARHQAEREAQTARQQAARERTSTAQDAARERTAAALAARIVTGLARPARETAVGAPRISLPGPTRGQQLELDRMTVRDEQRVTVARIARERTEAAAEQVRRLAAAAPTNVEQVGRLSKLRIAQLTRGIPVDGDDNGRGDGSGAVHRRGPGGPLDRAVATAAGLRPQVFHIGTVEDGDSLLRRARAADELLSLAEGGNSTQVGAFA